MTQPSIALCTLVLNEIEWLARLYKQHKDWPGLSRWVFVESADRVYAETNPSMVTSRGLSTDGTTEFLEELCKTDDRIVHIKYGTSTHEDPAQGKCASRQQYLDSLEDVQPKYFIVVDADEFYSANAQLDVIALMENDRRSSAFIFKHRDIWHPACLAGTDLFRHEVIGGFWDIPYCRNWRWCRNLTYSVNHNTPDLRGLGLDRRLRRFDNVPLMPYFVHMGFACDPQIRLAKNRYYAARGESKDPKRSWYVESRAAFDTWRPGKSLPRGARVCLYDGEIPECFKESE